MITKISKKFPNLNILVVDDYPTNLELMEELLQIMECKIATAVDGQEAVNMYEKTPYDIIFMDCQMPILDGYCASEQIREIEKNNDFRTHIIAVTANALTGDKEKCIQHGMDDYITKPVKSSTIQEKLDEYVSKNK